MRVLSLELPQFQQDARERAKAFPTLTYMGI